MNDSFDKVKVEGWIEAGINSNSNSSSDEVPAIPPMTSDTSSYSRRKHPCLIHEMTRGELARSTSLLQFSRRFLKAQKKLLYTSINRRASAYTIAL